jgi:hypothetical protein
LSEPCSSALAACGGGDDDDRTSSPESDATITTTAEAAATTTTTFIQPTATTTVPPTTTPPLTMPNGDPVFDEYPKLVALDSVDYRVRGWYEGKAPTGELVALAPGVYTPYNPNVPDLSSYFDGPSSGDCAMRREYFPDAGGACWEGVQ